MQNYEDDDRITARAQYCRRFIPGRLRSSRFNGEDGEISCAICRNWDGSNCSTDSFEGVFESFEG